MRQKLGRTLVVPAVLAVTVVAATACGDSKPSTTSDATSSSTAEPTTSGTTVMTMVPTSTGPVGTDTTDTDGLPDCSMYSAEAPCNAVAGCFWYSEIGQCVTDCEMIKDEATCKMQDFCEWFNDQCTLLLV